MTEIKSNPSVIFFGTPKIAAICLQALFDENITVLAVVTKSDKPQGRKKQISYSETKVLANKKGIKVFQPENLDDIYEDIKQLNPDLILSCAYGKIIPNKILDLAKFHGVNIHPSLLPKYRGATPIQSVIINGETETGVSFMQMTDKLDSGDILFQTKVGIWSNETFVSLYEKVSKLAYDMIRKNLKLIFSNQIHPVKQDDNQASFCTTLTRKDEKIDWTKSAKQIDSLVRALYFMPAAYVEYKDRQIKVYQAEVLEQAEQKHAPGEIYRVDKTGIYVGTSTTPIVIKSIQLSGKKRMEVSQMVNGKHPFKVGTKFH